jgi:poly(hydroxyalkanoate) granule-associated protein
MQLTQRQENVMAARKKPRGESASDATAQAVRDSAQKIWLAGLGAFERAKTDGPRMFEGLVEQGRAMGARAVGAADEALKNVRQADYSGKWDKLEQVFEDRVSRSLHRLGVLTSREVDELSRQVQDLNETVRTLMADGKRGAAPRAKGGTTRAGASRKKAAKAKAAGSPRARAKKPAAKARASRASRAPRA